MDKKQRFCRTEALLGAAAIETLAASSVMIVGLGGVGGYALEAVVRAGVGRLTLVDFDSVSESNINRQILADDETVGLAKTEAAAARARRINPDVKITLHCERVTPDNAAALLAAAEPSFVIDAIDDVAGKTALALAAKQAGVPLVMALGTGNRLDPAALRLTDLAKTEGCPLARKMRTALREVGIRHLPVVYSTEPPVRSLDPAIRIGSVSFLPSVAGLLLGGYVIRVLCGLTEPSPLF